MTTHNFDPARDELRLADLAAYDVLDTPAEKGFDDVVTLATMLCSTPVALVSLVDRDRQWFKARVGIEPCETDLDSSVCRHALGMTEILEIEDLAADPRTSDNPLVTGEPFLRFYAGAPLTTPDGRTLGTLCVIDKTPRPGGLTEAQRAGLAALANQVMAQLDLRRALAERQAAQAIALVEAARLEAMIATQQAVAVAKADLGVVFQAIVDGALRVVDHADGAVVEIRDGDALVYDTVSGTSEPHKGIRLPMEATLSGKAVGLERPLLCADTQADPEMDHALARDLGIRSMVVVPVTRRGEPIGALKVQSARPSAFSPRDVLMTQMLAGLVASAFGDVAEVRSKRALRDAESRYRRTFESVTEFGVVVTDLDCNVTEWNTGAERIFGWPADEMVGRNAEVFFTPEDRKAGRTKVEMRQALRDGQAVDERWHLRKDGSRFYASGNMMPLRDDDGTHLGFIKIVRDRTEQHLAGKRLETSEAQLRQAQEAGGVGLFTLDVASGLLTGTPEFSRLYGLPHRESRPATEVEATVLPEDRDQISTDATRRVGEAVRDARYRIRRPDTGEIRWIARKGDMRFASDGRPLAFVGIARDVTEQVATETALAESEAKWRELFENLTEGFVLGKVVRDADGRIIDWRYEEVNRAWGDLTGIDPATVVDRTVREIIPGVEDEWVAEFAGVVETGQPIRFTRQVGTLDRWYDGVCQPAADDRFTVIFMEVSARILAERRRETLRELGDALQATEEPDAMSNAAAALVGRALGVGRVGYGTVAADGETFSVPADWTREGYPSLAGVYQMSDYGGYAEDLRQGRTVVIPDIRVDPRTSANTAPLESVSVRTLVNHPVVEDGRTVAILYVNDAEPRAWTEEELAFLRDAADRTRAAIERRRAELAFRGSDERRRLALAIGEVGTFDLDLLTGFVILDERARAAFGVLDGRLVTQAEKIGAVHPDDRTAFDRVFRTAAAGGTFDLQFRTIGIDDGAVRWVALQGRVIGGNRFIGAVRDVTDRVAAEERRAVLNRELAHRLKNTLAVVQSVATQTLRTSPDIPSARKTLTERIGALSKAHDILLTGQRDAASITEIVRAATSLHDDHGRIRLVGPDVHLGPKASLTLSLILHELSTNAGKYGSLSVDEGIVDVAWSVRPSPETERPDLMFEWREVGGPPVVPPTRKSFGTRLIEMGLSGAAESSSEIVYAPEGLRCRLTGSLTELQSTDEADGSR